MAPPGTTALLVRLWGGGGAGGAGSAFSGSGGGGQGGYVEAFVPVSGGDSFTGVVGAGGVGAPGGPVQGANTVLVAPGGSVTAGGGAAGNTSLACTGRYPGRRGGVGSVLGAQGLLTAPGAAGAKGKSIFACAGLGDEAPFGQAGLGGGAAGFPGAGGNGADANAIPGAPGNGANGAIVIVSYT